MQCTELYRVDINSVYLGGRKYDIKPAYFPNWRDVGANSKPEALRRASGQCIIEACYGAKSIVFVN